MSSAGTPPTVSELAAATPSSRDRYVDLLRGLSIAVVVFGHWLIAVVYLRDGTLSGESALDAVDGVWILTWVLQVMPLFFFVGGFSNSIAYASALERGAGYPGFIRTRIERLMRPTVAFVLAWSILALVVQFLFETGEGFQRATALIAKPLWFLAVYMIVIALTPPMLALHRRYGWRVPVALLALASIVDVLRIALDVDGVAYLNFAFVWLFPHQLGFLYADGSLTRWGRRGYTALATGGLVALVVLVNLGVYSPSMVGMRTDKISNNDPPTVCLIALSVWLVGLAMSFRAPATRLLERRGPWKVVIAANSMIMTIFLWHLTAVLCAVLVLYPLGWPQSEPGTTAWWLSRPLWLLALAVFLAPFVAAFGRFERPRAGRRSDTTIHGRAWLAVTAIGLLVAGLAGFALGGFVGLTRFETGPLLGAPPPLLSALALAGGIVFVGASTRRGAP